METLVLTAFKTMETNPSRVDDMLAVVRKEKSYVTSNNFGITEADIHAAISKALDDKLG